MPVRLVDIEFFFNQMMSATPRRKNMIGPAPAAAISSASRANCAACWPNQSIFGASNCVTGTGHFQEFWNLEKHKVMRTSLEKFTHACVYILYNMMIYHNIIYVYIYIYTHQGSSRFVSPKRSLAFPQFAVAFGKLDNGALTVNLLGVKGSQVSLPTSKQGWW